MTENNPFGKLTASLLSGAVRNRSSWNDRFMHWERPASDTEEDQIQRAAAMVREALSASEWLIAEGVQIRPQGSYHNNTNVRQDSDMDLCAWHPGIMMVSADDVPRSEAQTHLGYFDTGRSIPATADRLRQEIGVALRSKFGWHTVDSGSKAFRVSAVPGSRADVDVVPAVRLDWVYRSPFRSLLGGGLRSATGIIIHAEDGRQIMNFPQQHHDNGKAKRQRTQRRFKKVVRTCKRLRDELVEQGALERGHVPSFLLECLVYDVEDVHFLIDSDDRYDRVSRVIAQIGEQLGQELWTSTALEINAVKLLFGRHQPWSVDHARAFVREAQRRMAL